MPQCLEAPLQVVRLPESQGAPPRADSNQHRAPGGKEHPGDKEPRRGARVGKNREGTEAPRDEEAGRQGKGEEEEEDENDEDESLTGASKQTHRVRSSPPRIAPRPSSPF